MSNVDFKYISAMSKRELLQQQLENWKIIEYFYDQNDKKKEKDFNKNYFTRQQCTFVFYDLLRSTLNYMC